MDRARTRSSCNRHSALSGAPWLNCRSARQSGPTFFHSDADPTTLLADPDIDLAFVTNASVGGRLDAAKRQRLLAFLAEPTVIVIDEAHHAGASSYQQILEIGNAASTVRAVIGLTATPWPTGARAEATFRSTFPRRFIELSQETLIGDGILARPIHPQRYRANHRLTQEELVETQRQRRSGPFSTPDTF